jgi:type VI secretion system secreted protein VgrG
VFLGIGGTKVRAISLVVLSLLWALSAYASAINVALGTADSFAVLAGSTVTNTGPTTIHGNLGVSPGSAVTGILPVMVTGGTIHSNDAVAMQAQNDLTTAYNFAAGEVCPMGNVLTGQDLGGLTLTPGVYCFSSSAQLTGKLTLNALGDLNAVFVFQIVSTLTTAPGSSVVFTNGGQGDSVFWQVGSSALIDTTTAFAGNILALTSITLNTGATITCGRALARNGQVAMDSNVVSIDTAGCETTTAGGGGGSVPEPATAGLASFGLLLSLIIRKAMGAIAGSRPL